MKSLLIALLVFCMGCVHTGVKQQEKTNMGMSSMDMGLNLEDYIGTWKVEKETYGCSPIKIEKGPTKGTIKVTRKSSVNTVSKNSPFDSLPKSTISDYYILVRFEN